MSIGKSGRKKSVKAILVIIVLIFIILLIHSILSDYVSSQNNDAKQSDNATNQENIEQQDVSMQVEGELILTMIDVGQADSFLLVQDGEVALVDCGTRSTGEDVVEYLQSIGIEKIDYVFGTHPHDDHMGGMYDVITNFEIGKIILPEIRSGEVTTNWYMKLMKEISEGDYVLETAEVGTIYNLGDATMRIIGPLSEPDDNLNNYSTVLKVSFGQMDVIMTGDAEKEIEEEILQSGEDVDAEIFKLGHHGSDTSNTEEFLDAVSPDYALISAKIGNKYEHPIKSTMEKLEERDIEVYRTDENGTVVVTITTDEASFSCAPGDYLSGAELEERETK